MPDAKIPILQQDALPLQSITEAGQPDSVALVGGQLIKFWGPSSTGINRTPRAADPVNPAISGYFSNYLDVRGCSVFQVVFLIETAGAGPPNGDDGAVFDLALQYRRGGVNPRSGLGGASGTLLFGTFLGGGEGNPGLISAAAGSSMVCTRRMALANASALGHAWVGTDCRLWVRYNVAGPNINYLLSVSVWATGP